MHPSSIVAKDASIDNGEVIMPGAIIRSKAKIEKYSIINSGSIIEHNTVIKRLPCCTWSYNSWICILFMFYDRQ